MSLDHAIEAWRLLLPRLELLRRSPLSDKQVHDLVNERLAELTAAATMLASVEEGGGSVLPQAATLIASAVRSHFAAGRDRAVPQDVLNLVREPDRGTVAAAITRVETIAARLLNPLQGRIAPVPTSAPPPTTTSPATPTRVGRSPRRRRAKSSVERVAMSLLALHEIGSDGLPRHWGPFSIDQIAAAARTSRATTSRAIATVFGGRYKDYAALCFRCSRNLVPTLNQAIRVSRRRR